eukprot:5628110-Lingulodinium_polyedra.AAC.1
MASKRNLRITSCLDFSQLGSGATVTYKSAPASLRPRAGHCPWARKAKTVMGITLSFHVRGLFSPSRSPR